MKEMSDETECDEPTAVNFDLTCRIMMTVMLSAKICMKDAAPSKNDGICDFDIARIAIGYEARRPGDCRRRAYQRAQRHRRLLAYRIELTESHDV